MVMDKDARDFGRLEQKVDGIDLKLDSLIARFDSMDRRVGSVQLRMHFWSGIGVAVGGFLGWLGKQQMGGGP